MKRSESQIARAIALVSTQPTWTPDEWQRVLLSMCETKAQAQALSNDLQRNGYMERQVVVTDRARKRAAT